MASTPALQIETSTSLPLLAKLRAAFPDFWALTKPEVNFLIVIATFSGFYLGCPGDLHAFPFGQLVTALCSTLSLSSCTGNANSHVTTVYNVTALQIPN